jgi:hypothetical protein
MSARYGGGMKQTPVFSGATGQGDTMTKSAMKNQAPH